MLSRCAIFLFDSVECSSANEENVVRVDLDVVLIGVFAPTLGGHVDDGAFEQLEHALLYAFTTDISRDRGVVSLACYLVYLSMKTIPRSALATS